MFIRRVGIFFLLILSLFLESCSFEDAKTSAYRIGIDSSWFPVDFQEKNPFVLGFTEELLLEISRMTGMKFEKINANWNTLLPDLKKEKYDAVLSSLPPYNFNLGQYEFSEPFLEIGPVLITGIDSKYKDLEQMKLKIVGLLLGSKDIMIVQKYPDIIIQMFDSYSEMLSQLEKGAVDGAIIQLVPAVGYLNDTFYDKLKIATPPLNKEALRLVTLKDKNDFLRKKFDKALNKLKNKKTYQNLLKKWNLTLGYVVRESNLRKEG